MSRFDFWTHGVATIIESPQKAHSYQHRTDIGTVVEQKAETDGWFHLAIPTPTVIDNSTDVRITHIALVAKVNLHAEIAELHLRRGADLVWSKTLGAVNTTVKQVFDSSDASMSKGTLGAVVALNVRVKFHGATTLGKVEFYGAGAIFTT